MTAREQYLIEQATELLSQVLKRPRALSLAEQEKLTGVYVSLSRICMGNRRPEPFHQWLAAQKNRRDNIGDLARWSEQDKNWPCNGDEGLAAFVERLLIANLACDTLRVPGAFGGGLIDDYLYPAWDEYTDNARRKPLQMVAGGAHR